MIGQKIKNCSFFNFLPEKLEKFRSTELYDAPLEGSTIFLYRSCLGLTSFENCRLAELKYAIFCRTERKTKKVTALEPLFSTVFKHGLLEGSTFLFQYTSITRTPLEISRSGKLKHAISAGQDVILKNKSIRKCKKALRRERTCTWSLYCGQVQTGSHRFGQVRTRVKRYFSSTVSRTLSKFGPSPNLRAVF